MDVGYTKLLRINQHRTFSNSDPLSIEYRRQHAFILLLAFRRYIYSSKP